MFGIKNIIVLGGLLVGLAGCKVHFPDKADNVPAKQSETERLRAQVEELQRQNGDLEKRLVQAGGLSTPLLDSVISVDHVKIVRHTRGYDDNQDGTDDGVIVYVRPYDRQGDNCKAVGIMEIKVLDSQQSGDSMLFHRWVFSGDELMNQWLSGFGTNYFKLTLAWPQGRIPQHRDLTIAARFVETLTGREFTDQHKLTINLP